MGTRVQRMPALIAFMRDHPNLAYNVNEIAREIGAEAGYVSSALSRQAERPESQIVSTGTRGFYMWTTTPQKAKETPEEMPDPAKLDQVGTTKDGNSVYKDADGNLWTAIFERL